MVRSLLVAGCLLAVALTMAPSTVGIVAFPPIVGVQIVGLNFVPAVATVPSGGVMFWTATDPGPLGYVPHSVTADDGSFDSPNLYRGLSFRHEFTHPPGSVVTYHCKYHLWMVGAVVVV